MTITRQHLKHAITHRKSCACDKPASRDANCEREWPDICPWWAYQLHRHLTGDFASPEWWEYQLGIRDDYSDEPPDPREFDAYARGTTS
jgi:hypothetical protein